MGHAYHAQHGPQYHLPRAAGGIADGRGVARGQLTPLPVWASEAIDLITELTPAGSLVGVLATQAEEALVRAAGPD